MRRGVLLVIVAAAVAVVPAVAIARHLANKRQHAAVVAGGVAAHAISRKQGRCTRVYISSIDSSWASLDFPAATSGKPRSCRQLAANGVSLFHRRHGRWRFVTAGSSFERCPPKGVPKRVAKDLKVC